MYTVVFLLTGGRFGDRLFYHFEYLKQPLK